MTKKHYNQGHPAKRQKNAAKPANDGSNEEILLADVKSLLSRHRRPEARLEDEIGGDAKPTRTLSYVPPDRFTEIEVKISELSSTGDGLGISPTSDHVYVVPFTVTGDVVQAKIVNHVPQANYTLTDFVKVIESAPQRDDSLVRCPYFAKCAGCQIQMLPYELQLQHKKLIMEKAYRNFSTLTPEVVPPVGETIGSPLQYGYRTKLTPHFDGPPGSMSRKAKRDPSERKGFNAIPPIGFMLKGTRKTVDIEDCPIGTDAVRRGMKTERERVVKEIADYTKGATILLRESTLRKPKFQLDQITASSEAGQNEQNETSGGRDAHSDAINGSMDKSGKADIDSARPDLTPHVDIKTCITDQRAISTEYVDDYLFKNTAGAFFQNNNSILPKITGYIRDHIMSFTKRDGTKSIKYLIDAYCGSGLFTITLSSLFSSCTGIDIAGASIVSARENAIANKISNASFMTADASKLFQEVTYPAEKTVVIIDPPRKGCDDPFLQQLLRFGPQRVIYVSCNVHTQARDVGVMAEGIRDCRYEIESLQGFDFFPQTGHVEGVAILVRSDKSQS
ncbi:tRNA(m5U54)methyltransferase [Mycoblastus sanguinarius]|nr:tRNA(m5U54)methyltransferase [Mycoblastus sanguinarius]